MWVISFGEDERNETTRLGFPFQTVRAAVKAQGLAGAATKQFYHYSQLVVSKRFSLFDFGAVKNRIKYGTELPPDYNLNSCRVPVAVFHSTNDLLANPLDVGMFAEKLPNLLEKNQIADQSFNHVDFLVATDAKELVYDRMIDLLKRFSISRP